MYQGSYFAVSRFNGGYCGNLPPTQLSTSQAMDLDNIVLLPNGLGWRTRLGNSKLNAVALNTSVQGVGYLLKSNGNYSLGVVSGSKFYYADPAVDNQIDLTGSVTITAGSNNIWDIFSFNDNMVAFGGPPTAPDAPITWTLSTLSNATTLTGSPPSAYGGLSTNNRVFAFRTSANPSTMFWSILGSATDWTGVGSGSAVVGSLNDNQIITAAKVLNASYMVVFKEASTWQVVLTAAPFPVYSLFQNVGCVGKNAAVNVDGTIYWVNQFKRMNSTDGTSLQTYPPDADDLWDSIQVSQLAYVVGFRQKGKDYDWLVWCVSNAGSTNKVAIIWDLLNKCWLRCTTGYTGMQCAGYDKNGKVYLGKTDGFIYKPDQTGIYADASETAPGTITGYWRSGWLNPENLDKIVQVNQLEVNCRTKASGNLTVNYGFDFNLDQSNFTLSQTATGTELYTNRGSRLTGRGNAFNFKVSQSSSTIDSEVHKILLRGKVYGQKVISAG